MPEINIRVVCRIFPAFFLPTPVKTYPISNNYCPLLFMEESGRNRTPDKLPAAERAPLEALCDDALAQMVALLRPEWVVGVGQWARMSAERALAGTDVRVGQLLHPSPASPAANRGWAPQAEAQLRELGIL